MNGMIFAAGLGTRLRPLTNNIPKALVRVNDIPLLEYAILKFKRANIHKIVINIHHFADKVETFLKEKKNFGVEIIISDERSAVLETGGGLNKAKNHLMDAPFVVMNADVLSNIDLNQLMAQHLQSKPLATLAVRQRTSSRYLLFDKNKQLVGWKNTKTSEERISKASNTQLPFAFSGIHVIDPQIFEFMPQEDKKFSIIDTYLEAAKTHRILAYPHDQDIWLDVGKPDQLAKAAAIIPQIQM